eukprot:CAMPEP_0197636156 /NCGR_PEP_ID=MMETSP1338-20131121/11755_1 /TAXON_ID=43686 ORGANISM="Pelagodinium beii, Strain RCC1491" /NCGR_SAMPLE_ID=MMETSP1338 /ASSEMBLY_ACC=CAM_ASM_000754 /LENGTH=49 /DNA_ID=CAMNT_0043208345 /DNA_START=956 /DNA_END=1106 /DNA_ORIENTATION=-
MWAVFRIELPPPSAGDRGEFGCTGSGDPGSSCSIVWTEAEAKKSMEQGK